MGYTLHYTKLSPTRSQLNPLIFSTMPTSEIKHHHITNLQNKNKQKVLRETYSQGCHLLWNKWTKLIDNFKKIKMKTLNIKCSYGITWVDLKCCVSTRNQNCSSIKRDPSQERTLGKSEALLFAFSLSSLEHNGSRFKGENGGLRICGYPIFQLTNTSTETQLRVECRKWLE